MVEISLEEFEEFYKQRINDIFFKAKRVSKKQISDIEDALQALKLCISHFEDAGKEKIDQKVLKSFNFFTDRMRKEVNEIEIPKEELTYENLNALLNSIKRLFSSISEIARKSLPKFQKEVQPQIKEMDYLTRKLGKKQAMLDQFLKKKYKIVKNAEDLLEKLPKLVTLRENIENSKKDLEIFKKDFEERKQALEKLNAQLLEVEKNELFKVLERERDNLYKIKEKINDQLGFRKGLKKLKVELDKESIRIPNLDSVYLKEILKNPIDVLSNESKDLPKFSNLLIQLRRILEEDKLNLKLDKKDKTIEQINAIFSEKIIHKDIEDLKALEKKIKDIEQKIKDAGLAQKLDDIKTQISISTVKLEHVENDLNRKNKDYLKYLETLKNEREAFQNAIEEVIEEPVKINITFSF